MQPRCRGHHGRPTLLRTEGFRFFFFSNEGTEPPPVHVHKAEVHGKWWLDPPTLACSKGFTGKELRRIRELIFAHRIELMERGNEHFSSCVPQGRRPLVRP